MSILSETKLSKEENPRVKEAVDMFREMEKSRKKITALKAQCKVWDHEHVRFRKLEIIVNKLWTTLTNAQQIEAAEILVKSNEMNPKVLDMLTIFEGRITGL